MKIWKKQRKNLHILLAVFLILGLVGGSVAGVAHYLAAPQGERESAAEQDFVDHWQQKEQELIAILEDDPDDVGTVLSLADLYYEKGNHYIYREELHMQGAEILLDAQKYYNKSLQIEPGLPEARFHSALISFTLGEMDKAGEELEKLTREFPEEHFYRFYYGMYFFSGESDFAKAVEQWETLLKGEPEDPWLEEETNYWLGRAREALEE